MKYSLDNFNNEEQSYKDIGAELQKYYPRLVVSKDEKEYNDFEQLLSFAVENTALLTSKELSNIYMTGVTPLLDDTIKVGILFIKECINRHRIFFCSELFESNGTTSDTREIILAFIPSIITLFSLPITFTALSIPISIIITKIGLNNLCKDIREKIKDKSVIEQRIKIHSENLKHLNEQNIELPDFDKKKSIELEIECLKKLEKLEKYVSLAKINKIKTDGNNNIVIQDINNSTVEINVNSSEMKQFLEYNYNRLEEIKLNISEQNNTMSVLLDSINRLIDK